MENSSQQKRGHGRHVLREGACLLITQSLNLCEDSRLLLCWSATHPRAFSATLVVHQQGDCDQSSAICRRLPYVPNSDSFFCKDLPRLHTHLRLSGNGNDKKVYINDCSTEEPLDAAKHHILLLALLYTTYALSISLTAIKSGEALHTLLASLENHAAARIETLCVSDTTCVIRRGGVYPYSALKDLVHFTVLAPLPGSSQLAGVKTLSCLREIDVSYTTICSLGALASLRCLSVVRAAGSDIGDVDIVTLSALCELQVVDVSECPLITDVNPLAAVQDLLSLNAGICPSLRHFSLISTNKSIIFLDLSAPEDAGTGRGTEVVELLSTLTASLESLHLNHAVLPRVGARFDGEISQEGTAVRPMLASTATGVKFLYLMGSVIHDEGWLTRMPRVEQLYLDRSNVTDAQLATICAHMPQLRVLSLSNCNALRTSLSCLEQLLHLTLVHVSRTCLLAENAADVLRARGISLNTW